MPLPRRAQACSRGRVIARTIVLCLFLAAPAYAADAGDEADDLARQIAQQGEALSTDDCTAACSALASMRRAADRLCALDPGARCRDARRIVDVASRKVRAACPQCAIAMQPGPEEGAMPVAKTASAPPEPQAERASGGCASCGGGGGAASSVMGLFGVLLVLKRMARAERERDRRDRRLP